MRHLSSEQCSVERYIQQWHKSKKTQVPSWWLGLAPRQTTAFWRAVEAMRKEAGVTRGDVSGMTYIINQLRSAR